MPKCYNCKTHLPSVNSLYYHFHFDHKMDLKGAMICGEDACERSFSTWQLLRKHLLRFHSFPSNAKQSNPVVLPIVENNQEELVNSINHDGDKEVPGNSLNENELSLADVRETISSQASMFIAKLYANPKLPRSHVQSVVEDISEHLGNIVNAIKRQYSGDDHLNYHDDLDALASAFEPFSSDFKRLKFFEKSGCLIKAVEKAIGNRREYVRENNRRLPLNVPSTAQYVPMRKVLKAFLELPGVFKGIIEYMTRLDQHPEVLQNLINGRWWREKRRLYEGKVVLPLFLYFDDLEINNVLGSHRGIQKLGVLYFSIACLPPEYASSLENIFLSCLFHSLDRVERGSNIAIFTYVVEELNFLARDGIQIEVDGEITQVYFILARVLGDNLGLSSIEDFVESFVANFYCRICKRHRSDCQKDCEEREDFLRTPENYATDALLPVSETGIHESSVWNRVDNFHVTENWTVDAMHDIWEGVCQYDMSHILYSLIIVQRVFTVDDLNDRLLAFDFYGNALSNQPPTLDLEKVKNRNICMSANEMRCFVLCFTLLVGHLVPSDNSVWKFFLVLRRIVDIISARVLQRSAAKLLKVLVKEHNALYCQLFQDSLKPKHHFLVHYDRVLTESGPIPYLNSLRFESTHTLIKGSASSTTSRRNITFTLAIKFQLNLCKRLLARKGFERRLETGPVDVMTSVTDFENFQNFDATIATDFATCLCTTWIDYKGTKYRIGSCLIVSCDENCEPSFGIISEILVNEKQSVCLVCKLWSCDGFDEHLHAYCVSETTAHMCILIDNLIDPFPLIFSQMPCGTYFAVPKHGL